MKVVQINATCGSGSTGKICLEISKLLTQKEIENYIYFVSGTTDYPLGKRYMKSWEIRLAVVKSRIFGNWGFNSNVATRRLIKQLAVLQPEIVHLHNIHGHNCNLEILFDFFEENKIKVIWTFHDCWAFTGYCMHYDMIGCHKWKTRCEYCPQCNEYSWLIDRSREIYLKKKKMFDNTDFTVVTPSVWLAEQARTSFLKNHKVEVINNGIDLSVFKPTVGDFREKYDLQDKYIVLGVAFGWGERKGLDVFAELAEKLSSQYQIVLVGTDNIIDKNIPSNIISIHRTQNQQELAMIYSAADVFVNPTREETYPTVNMESLACGTPVITFDSGGSSEIINETCGVAVEKNDVDSLRLQILRICETKPYTENNCLKRAEIFDMHQRFNEYIDLYERVME